MDYGVWKEWNAKYEVRIMDCGVRGAGSVDVKYGVRIMDCGRSMCVRYNLLYSHRINSQAMHGKFWRSCKSPKSFYSETSSL